MNLNHAHHPAMGHKMTFQNNVMILAYVGIVMIILGIIASVLVATSSLSSGFYLGLLLLFGGIIQIAASFSAIRKDHLFLNIFVGIIYLVAGTVMIDHSAATITTISLFLALFFMVNGLYKVAISAIDRFQRWGWVFFNGIVTFIMGLLIWRQWPSANIWLIGLYLGIELIIWGIALTLLSYSAEREV